MSKISEKINKFKNSLIEEDENEYENFYNRISFYFSNIVTELKLSFVEQIKVFQSKETDLLKKIYVSYLRNNFLLEIIILFYLKEFLKKTLILNK